MDRFKFVALDRQDLEVVSAHLQDAVVDPAEILWWPNEHRLVIGLGRFDWDAAQAAKPEFRRRRSALRFDRVLSCQARGVDPTRDKSLSLLAVEFSETDAPSGVITLIFSGQATFRLNVECLEAELVDLGPTWTEIACPAHRVDGDQTA